MQSSLYYLNHFPHTTAAVDFENIQAKLWKSSTNTSLHNYIRGKTIVAKGKMTYSEQFLKLPL